MGEDDFSWLAIGIHKPTVNDPWQWTDGRPVTFTSWEAGYQDDPASIAFLGVFGRLRDDYVLRNGHWEGDKTSANANWQGICESNPF